MIRKLLASCAALALACSPGYAAGWYPGFTGTGQVAPTGQAASGGGTTTAGCNTTGGYQGYGDCIPSAVTVQRYYALRAFSYSSAQAGQYLARVYGDGATGDAGTGVYADVRAKADGTPDFANAVSAAGTTISILPGAGVVSGTAGNPCFGGDGKCRVALYDGTTQTTTASTGGAIASNGTVALRPLLFQNCQNNTNVTTIPSGNTRSCLQHTPNQSLQDASLTAVAVQPYSLETVTARPSGNASALGYVAYGTAYIGSGAANTLTVSSGTVGTVTVTDGAPISADVVFNGASSLLQVNGTLVTSAGNYGNTQSSSGFFVGQRNGGNVLTGVTFESAYTTGTWDASHLAAEAANKSAFYSLGY